MNDWMWTLAPLAYDFNIQIELAMNVILLNWLWKGFMKTKSICENGYVIKELEYEVIIKIGL